MISCVLFALGIIILVVLRVSSLLNEFVLFALQLKGGEDFADWISRCMSLEPQDVILFKISSLFVYGISTVADATFSLTF